MEMKELYLHDLSLCIKIEFENPRENCFLTKRIAIYLLSKNTSLNDVKPDLWYHYLILQVGKNVASQF